MKDIEARRVFIWEDKSTWTSVKTDFALHYTHIRGYHGCRPLNIEFYYKKGFMPPKKKMLREHVVTVLEDKCNSKENIEILFGKAWKEYYGKGIYFGLCKNFLLNNCGHYLNKVNDTEIIYLQYYYLYKWDVKKAREFQNQLGIEPLQPNIYGGMPQETKDSQTAKKIFVDNLLSLGLFETVMNKQGKQEIKCSTVGDLLIRKILR